MRFLGMAVVLAFFARLGQRGERGARRIALFYRNNSFERARELSEIASVIF